MALRQAPYLPIPMESRMTSCLTPLLSKGTKRPGGRAGQRTRIRRTSGW